MSSAIIFINKAGVAVAADSATTIGNRRAILNTAQKIFPIGLQNNQQILVITFDNANFMGVPIELILKSYSKHIQDHNYFKNTLEEYMNDFIRYVEENQDELKINSREYNYLYTLFYRVLAEYLEEIEERVLPESTKEEYNTIIHETLKKIVQENEDEIKDNIENDESKNLITEAFLNTKYPKLLEEIFRDEYAEFIEKKTNKKIEPEKIDLLDDVKVIFENFKTLIFEKIKNKRLYQRYSQSGIYFVGFGQKSIYPSYYGFSAMALLNRRFVYENDYRREVSSSYPAHYKTLAQDDSIEAFIIGVNWNSRVAIRNKVRNLIDEKISSLETDNAQDIVLLNNVKKNIHEEIDNLKLFKFLEKEKEDEFLSSLSVMGVADMAEYAENLVSLQSLKRKYDLDSESNATVGGPTDVAVITKFEGFKWIKFKHHTK
jgi:hypothetical protein